MEMRALLDNAGELVALLAAIAALPFIGYLAKRWWERPQLRVKVREHDLTPNSDGRLQDYLPQRRTEGRQTYYYFV